MGYFCYLNVTIWLVLFTLEMRNFLSINTKHKGAKTASNC